MSHRPDVGAFSAQGGGGITLSSNRLPPPPVSLSSGTSASANAAAAPLSMVLPLPPTSLPSSRGDEWPSSSQAKFALPWTLCVSKRQLTQAKFNEDHQGDLVKFWSQRYVEAEKLPLDASESFELRTTTVRRIMRAALKYDDSRSEVGGQVDAARRPPQISDGAVRVMSKACEIMCKDLAKRGELVQAECRTRKKRRRVGGISVLKAIQKCDYFDFLQDVTASARAEDQMRKRKRGKDDGQDGEDDYDDDDDEDDDDDDDDQDDKEEGDNDDGGEAD